MVCCCFPSLLSTGPTTQPRTHLLRAENANMRHGREDARPPTIFYHCCRPWSVFCVVGLAHAARRAAHDRDVPTASCDRTSPRQHKTFKETAARYGIAFCWCRVGCVGGSAQSACDQCALSGETTNGSFVSPHTQRDTSRAFDASPANKLNCIIARRFDE